MRLRIVVLLILAVTSLSMWSCGRSPGLAFDQVDSVRFSSLASGESWVATETEVRRLVESYADAEDLPDDFGTTPPARIDVVLKTGDTLAIWGGGEHFQTVGWRGRQFNIRSDGLHGQLEEIASRG